VFSRIRLTGAQVKRQSDRHRSVSPLTVQGASFGSLQAAKARN